MSLAMHFAHFARGKFRRMVWVKMGVLFLNKIILFCPENFANHRGNPYLCSQFLGGSFPIKKSAYY